MYVNMTDFDLAINHGDIVASVKRHFALADFLFSYFAKNTKGMSTFVSLLAFVKHILSKI